MEATGCSLHGRPTYDYHSLKEDPEGATKGKEKRKLIIQETSLRSHLDRGDGGMKVDTSIPYFNSFR